MTFDHQFVFAALSVIIAFSTMIYSSWQIWHRIIQPHSFTVLVWFIVTTIVFFSMMAEEAGLALWRTGMIAVMLLVNFLLSLRNGFGYINRFDVGMLIAALMGIPIWQVMDDPEAALFWLTVVGFCGTIPTLRKAWNTPQTLSATVYFFTSLAILLQMGALQNFSLGMMTYLSVTGGTFLVIAGVLVYRGRKVAV